MSVNPWSTAISLYNPTKFKQLFLLTLRELSSMLIVLGIATALLIINMFFLRLPYVTSSVMAAVLFCAILTTRSSSGLKNIGYYFRYSWLLLLALLLVALSEIAYRYSSILAAMIILLSIFLMLCMADICFKNMMSTEDFVVPFKSLKILFFGIPFVLPVFVLFAILLYGISYIPYLVIVLPLVLSFLIVWCANWYIIALYDQR
jgi:hypothetical protein